MSSSDSGILRETYDAIFPYSDAFIEFLFKDLTDAVPGLGPKLESIGTRSNTALINFMKHVVEFQSEPEHLSDYLKKMGSKLSKAGYCEEHCKKAAESFLTTLRYFFGTNWTENLNSQWESASQSTLRNILEGIRSQSSTANGPAIDIVAKELANELFRRALAEAFKSEDVSRQIRSKVHEMIQHAIQQEAQEIRSTMISADPS